MHTYELYIFTHSEDVTGATKFINGSRDPDHAASSSQGTRDIAYMCTKFHDSSFSRFRYMTGVPEFIVGHITLTMPFIGSLSSIGQDLLWSIY